MISLVVGILFLTLEPGPNPTAVVDAHCEETYNVEYSTNLQEWVILDSFDSDGGIHTYEGTKEIEFFRTQHFSQVNQFTISESFNPNLTLVARIHFPALICSGWAHRTTELWIAGHYQAFAKFRGGYHRDLGMESGIILSTGHATNAYNIGTSVSTNLGLIGHPNIPNSFDRSFLLGNMYGAINPEIIAVDIILQSTDPDDLFILYFNDREYIRIPSNTSGILHELRIPSEASHISGKNKIGFEVMDIGDADGDTFAFIRKIKVID